VIYYGLLLFFVLDYVRPGSYVPGLTALRLNSIVPLANFAGTILSRGATAWEYVAAERNTWIIAFILLLVFGSFLTADVTLFAYQGLTTLLGYAMAYWVIMSEVTTRARIKGVFVTLVFVHLAVAYLNPILFTDPNNRHYITSGFFLGDGNDFALSVNVAVPLCLFLLLDAKKKILKLAWALALLILIACVVLTQSRGGTIALAAMGLYYWLKSPKKAQTAMIGAVVVTLILAFAPGAYWTRMAMLADTQEGSASGRIGAWKVAVRMAADHPLLGVGAGHFGVKYGLEYRTRDVEGSGMTAHSLYFLALGELGVPGLAVVLFFVFWNLAENKRLILQLRSAGAAREPDVQLVSSASASLIAFASGAAFLSCLYYPHIYILCGILGATRHVVRESAVGAPVAVPVPVTPVLTYHPALRKAMAAAPSKKSGP
jgi:probable O-glycosylation ligase (exosortase A-associated)